MIATITHCRTLLGISRTTTTLLRRMATTTIAVLNESELKDGQMYVSLRMVRYYSEFDMFHGKTGRKLHLGRKERSCFRGLVIRYMRQAHSVHTMEHHWLRVCSPLMGE